MKKVFAILVCLMLALCTLFVMPVSAAGSITLSTETKTAKQGDTVTVSVRVTSNSGFAFLTVTPKYDSSVLELTSTANGSVCSGYTAGKNPVWNGNGVNVTATGTLVTFTFQVKDTAKAGDAYVGVTVRQCYDADSNDVVVNALDGKITVACKAHIYSAWTKADNSNHSRTCSACGNTETKAHSWNSGNETITPSCTQAGEKTYTCSVCNGTKTETLDKKPHAYGEWARVDDSTHKHICSVCKKEETASHSWGSGSVTKPATCKDEGVRTYTCTCKATKTEVINKLDTHKYGAWQKVDVSSHERVCSVCNKKETGSHSYGSRWSKDKNQHWHACTVCNDKQDVADHTPGPEATEKAAQVCTTCSYIIKPALAHTHKFAEEWTKDETGHWHICSGCEEQGSFAEHDFENPCDPDCSICGYTRQTAHSFIMKHNETAHWEACEGCGLTNPESKHIPGPEATEEAAQTCTECGYELAPALTPAPTETEATQKQPSATQSPVSDNATEETGGFPWAVLLVAGLAILAIVVIIIKKRQ